MLLLLRSEEAVAAYTDAATGGPVVLGYVGESWSGPPPGVGLPQILPVPKVEIAFEVEPGAYALAYQTRARAALPSVHLRLQEAAGSQFAAWSRYGTRVGTLAGTPLYQQASPLSDAEAYALDLQTTAWISVAGLDEIAEAPYVTFAGWLKFPAAGAAKVLVSFGTYSLVDGYGGLGFSTGVSDCWGVARPAAGWHFVCATMAAGNSEADEGAIYVDGVWAGVMSRRGAAPNSANAVFTSTAAFGATVSGASQAAAYQVAEPALMPYALSAAQVAALWDARTEAAAPSMDPATWDWTDVSADLIGWFSTRGRQSELERVEPTEITLALRNYQRQYEPEYAASPYYPNVVPMRPARASALWGGDTYSRWFGQIVDFPLDWSATRHGSVNLEVVDAIALMSRKPPISAFFPEQYSGARVEMILDAVGFPEDRRQIAAGASLLSALDTTASPADPATLLESVSTSERGAFFIDRDGVAVFHDRRTRIRSPYTISQAAWGDGGVEAGELPYVGINPVFTVKKVKNVIKLATVAGLTAQARDVASIRANDELLLELANLQNASQGELDDYATVLLSELKDPTTRFDAVSLDGRRDASLAWPKILPREFSDRITVVRRPPYGSAAIVKETHIERLVEKVDYSGQQVTWQLEWQLSPASLIAYWELNTSALGVSTRLGF